jgi:hypothetical protein
VELRNRKSPVRLFFISIKESRVDKIDFRQIRVPRPMTEAAIPVEVGHVNGRGMVSRAGDFRLVRLCGLLGGGQHDGTQLGEETREMTASRARPALGREIAVVLAAKLVLLTCLYFAFFAPSQRPASDSAAVAAKLLDVPPK